MEPTIKNFNKNVIEENLNNVIDKLVDLIFEELNKGKEANVIKQQVLDYIYNQMIFKQQIYNWLIENQNDSNSIYLLGYFNYYGIETKFNEHRAIELYKRAAELENKVAQLCLAEIYIEIDGICYENGIGTNVNEEKAFEMYQKAADLGNVSGINNLSWCYYEGIGTDTNKQKVFELYQKAADLESLDGINSLGWCYEKGIGTNIDKQKAFELYQKAENLEAQLFWLNV
ncbi:kinase-like domain-containing protein [Rhizophagus irregularis DAOM 181602=DAOM 197198]|nr:kinase-like domain-containing protein [Rhizophagus irregularis DAOM 181602=DAOM 197198]